LLSLLPTPYGNIIQVVKTPPIAVRLSTRSLPWLPDRRVPRGLLEFLELRVPRGLLEFLELLELLEQLDPRGLLVLRRILQTMKFSLEAALLGLSIMRRFPVYQHRQAFVSTLSNTTAVRLFVCRQVR
jgi:hypothetical protein